MEIRRRIDCVISIGYSRAKEEYDEENPSWKGKKSKKIFIVERGYSKRNGKLSEETREQVRRE